MNRRTFLVVSGQGAISTLATRVTSASATSISQQLSALIDLERRLARVIEAFDAQGNHRTATEVDRQSGEWLAAQVQRLGVDAVLEPFTLKRIDLRSCYVRVADRRIDSVPLFDAGFTSPEGVKGVLGPLGSNAEIALVESEPARVADTDPVQRDQVEEARRASHKAVVVLTRGPKPGLFLLNASRFTAPAGPPMLQVSSAETTWLRERAVARAEATLVAHVDRTIAQAFNVTARIAGTRPALAPLVIMAPRSGWWQCASEQGSRLACWLEVIRAVKSGEPVRDCFFVALSGHELGLLGMDPYLKRHPDLLRRSGAWIFFGSDIGAPHQPNLIHASDEALERWGVTAMEHEGITVDAKARYDSIARGETRAVQQAGGRFFTVACDSQVFHNPTDRWPESIDVSNLARYARAFANGVLQLARSA
jgi:hypothetical protein